MKKYIEKIGTALLVAALSAILTNLITGQPLGGLVKLKGLAQFFVKSAVPAWVFALTLFVALLGLYDFVRRALANRKRRVHFVPDSHNCGWAQSGAEMEVRAGGTFTYEGTGALTVLKAFLEGTYPVTDMMVLQEGPGLSQPVPVRELHLAAHIPVRAYVNVRLSPVLGVQGKILHSRLVFRDKFNRDFPFEVKLPYIGQQ